MDNLQSCLQHPGVIFISQMLYQSQNLQIEPIIFITYHSPSLFFHGTCFREQDQQVLAARQRYSWEHLLYLPPLVHICNFCLLSSSDSRQLLSSFKNNSRCYHFISPGSFQQPPNLSATPMFLELSVFSHLKHIGNVITLVVPLPSLTRVYDPYSSSSCLSPFPCRLHSPDACELLRRLYFLTPPLLNIIFSISHSIHIHWSFFYCLFPL